MVMQLWRGLWCAWLSGLLLWGSGVGLAAEADTPTAVVYHLIAAIRRVGTAEQGKVVSSEPSGAATANAAHVMLDIPAMSQRTLGKHWAGRSPAEQQEFIALFTQLLSQIILPKASSFFQSLEMTATTERITGQQAVVKTTLRHPKVGRIAIDYLLVRPDDTWRIHDVVLEGMSLAANLRSQFNHIITQHSYPEFLRRMHEKVAHATLQAAR
jgi:phospholipid transport system substrate-binding protein